MVNNDHYLYWGDVVKTNEEGTEFHIQVKNSFYLFPLTVILLQTNSYRKLSVQIAFSKCNKQYYVDVKTTISKF